LGIDVDLVAIIGHRFLNANILIVGEITAEIQTAIVGRQIHDELSTRMSFQSTQVSNISR
jgi:hypothetical protein